MRLLGVIGATAMLTMASPALAECQLYKVFIGQLSEGTVAQPSAVKGVGSPSYAVRYDLRGKTFTAAGPDARDGQIESYCDQTVVVLLESRRIPNQDDTGVCWLVVDGEEARGLCFGNDKKVRSVIGKIY